MIDALPPETLFLAAKMGYGKTSWILRVSWGLVCFWNCIFLLQTWQGNPSICCTRSYTVLWKTLFCYYRHSDRDSQSCSAALKTGTHLGIQWAYFDPGATTTISVFLCHPYPHYQSHLSPNQSVMDGEFCGKGLLLCYDKASRWWRH